MVLVTSRIVHHSPVLSWTSRSSRTLKMEVQTLHVLFDRLHCQMTCTRWELRACLPYCFFWNVTCKRDVRSTETGWMTCVVCRITRNHNPTDSICYATCAPSDVVGSFKKKMRHRAHTIWQHDMPKFHVTILCELSKQEVQHNTGFRTIRGLFQEYRMYKFSNLVSRTCSFWGSQCLTTMSWSSHMTMRRGRNDRRSLEAWETGEAAREACRCSSTTLVPETQILLYQVKQIDSRVFPVETV